MASSVHPLSDGREHLFDRRRGDSLTLTLTPSAQVDRSATDTLEALLGLLQREVDLTAVTQGEATLFLARPSQGAELLHHASQALPNWRVEAAVGPLSDPSWPLALRVRVPRHALTP